MIYLMESFKSKKGHTDITSPCPKNYDSKKTQLNEFIYIERFHLLGYDLSF